jgi:hypothetical protein
VVIVVKDFCEGKFIPLVSADFRLTPIISGIPVGIEVATGIVETLPRKAVMGKVYVSKGLKRPKAPA